MPAKFGKTPKPGNKLRIIGGQWRGRKLAFPSIPGLRPTPDRIRETLFNWLTANIEGSACLDLFSGSGALGLEALSRGAKHTTFVDQSSAAINQLQQHLSNLDCNRANLIKANALEWLLKTDSSHNSFDIVFLDPPFGQNLLERSANLLNQGLLTPNAYIYLECERELEPRFPEGWKVHRHKAAGQGQCFLCVKAQ